MPGPPDDAADAVFLHDLLVAVAARHKTQPSPGRARTLMRRAIELIWEKPRESGEAYGQYRHNFHWTPAAIQRANANLAATGYNGDRGLVKEHVVPYKVLIKQLLKDARSLTPQTLADALGNSLRVAVITATEDTDLRIRLKELSFTWPDDLDLTDPAQAWIRYVRGGVDMSAFRSVRLVAQADSTPSLEADGPQGIPGLSSHPDAK